MSTIVIEVEVENTNWNWERIDCAVLRLFTQYNCTQPDNGIRTDKQIHVFITMRETEIRCAVSIPHLVWRSNIFEQVTFLHLVIDVCHS